MATLIWLLFIAVPITLLILGIAGFCNWKMPQLLILGFLICLVSIYCIVALPETIMAAIGLFAFWSGVIIIMLCIVKYDGW